MRKSTKIAAIVAAAALLVLGMAFTSMAAAKGWTEEGGVWVWLDKDGERVTECWKPGADGAQYWLDENGEMAVDQLIEDNGYTYYVGADGKMAKNFWLPQDGEEDEAETIYYYFGANGRAKKGDGGLSFVTIDGQKYAFDTDGKMLYGWLKEGDGSIQDTDENETWAECIYYCGSYQSGKRVSGAWKQIDVYFEGDAETKAKWFYFGSNGKKYADAMKTISGKKYLFEANGVMDTGIAATPEDSSPEGNYYFTDNGDRVTKKWVWKVPTKAQNEDDHEEETSRWFYAGSNGEFYTYKLAKINNKYYAFNENGIMLSGLYKLTFGADGKTFSADPEVVDEKNFDDYTALKYYKTTAAGLYFFGEEQSDGSLKTGTAKVDIDGEEKTMKFSTNKSNRGEAINGINGSSLYVNGLKVVADSDMKYQLLPATVADGDLKTIGCIGDSLVNFADAKNGTKYVVVAASGAIIKTGTKTDGDGYKATIAKYQVTKIVNENKGSVY